MLSRAARARLSLRLVMSPSVSPTTPLWGSSTKSRTPAECQWYRRARLSPGFMPCCTTVQSPPVLTTKECRYKLKPSCTHVLSILALSFDARTRGRGSRPVRSPTRVSSDGVLSECLPRPPQTYRPRCGEIGLMARLSAPMTLVVIPEECQSMPMTHPSAWNQNGSDILLSTSMGPRSSTIASTIHRPMRVMRSPSHAGTRP